MKKSAWHKIVLAAAVVVAAGYLLVVCTALSGRRTDGECTRLQLLFTGGGEPGPVDGEEIERLLKVSGLHPVGRPLAEIQTEQIERGLASAEMIRSAECYLTPSGTVYIRVGRRVPKFRVVGDTDYYVDTDRRRIRTAVGYAAYLPVVSGHVTEEMATGALFDFVTYLEENDFWNAQIEQIYVCPDGKVELVPRVGEGIIVLGTLEGYEAKFDKLKKLYLHGFNEIGWNRYKTIDLRYKGQVVCTKK